MISHHAALIYTLVLVSAADREMDDSEMSLIGGFVRTLPAFRDYEPEMLPATCAACAEILDQEGGLEKTLDLIAATLPLELRETAYALSCDVAASNGHLSQEELRVLELIRHRLDIDRLHAAAIERGTRARYHPGPRDI